MKRFSKRFIAACVSVSMLFGMGGNLGSGTATAFAEEQTSLTEFEQEFLEPDDDARPYMRWWIAPGRMTEEQTRREIKSFAEGGYTGVELQCLELAKGCVINDEIWNETMKWILKAGLEYGVQIDFTIGQMWPIATPAITDIDDTRAEQQLLNASVNFTASEGAMQYEADSYVYPRTLATNRAHELVAVTAAKKLTSNTYDPTTAVSLLDENQITSYDESTGEITWTAPSEGDWTIFYFYRQSAGHIVGYGIEQYVVDHMSAEATQAVTQNWEDAMNSDPELKELYERNAGSLFGDSFELKSSLWTLNMLEEFKERRGYDLTPYLPAISNTFSEIGDRVRDDLYTTMTELLAENHMDEFRKWANSHNMTLRYQAYSSAGSSVFELTAPALATDIIEVESYAMSGTNPDAYRQLSGAVNMRGDKLFTAEAAEIGNDSWRATWTDTQVRNGASNRHLGFMHYAYRLFAAGVNKMVFHGATYKFTDTEASYFPINVTWPGYSAMSALSYGNEWDDKTPMWENIDIATDALSRMEMVLQQGQGDVDLAVYRFMYGKGNTRSNITAVEQAGYTYDYVTSTVLNMDNAVIGDQDGNTVLAPDGPSYKAIVIEAFSNGNASEMPLETAEMILEYAKGGLPVVIVGQAPYKVSSYPGSDDNIGSAEVLQEADAQLVKYMDELKTLDNVKTAADRAELVTVLAELDVEPDAKPESPANVYYHHRNTAEADLYFIYNDASAPVEQSLTLKGSGMPYLLDPWSGEITPIAEYTVGNGTVTIDMDLASQDAMIVAVAKEGWSSKTLKNGVVQTNADSAVYNEETSSAALRTADGGELSALLADGTTVAVAADAAEAPINLTDWTMALNRWTEGEHVHDTVIVKSNEYDLSQTGLVPWYEIDAQNLTRVAGVGVYKTSFVLEKGWEEGQGAYLDFTRVSDIMRLYINDTEVPVNQISVSADIGKYLTAGTNTIVAEVSSNVSNVIFGTSANNTYAFGIIGDVTLTPYTQIEIAAEEVLDLKELKRAIANAEEIKDKVLPSETRKAFDDAYNYAVEVYMLAEGLTDALNADDIDQSVIDKAAQDLKAVTAAADAMPKRSILLYWINAGLEASVSEEYANAVPVVQNAFDKALEKAEEVFDKVDADQAEIYDAAWEMMEQIHALGIYKGDKSELETLVNYYNSDQFDLDNYEDGQEKDDFEAALSAAEGVLSNQNATDDIIESALNILKDAASKLDPKPGVRELDYDELKEAIRRGKLIDLEKYADKGNTKSVFQNALAEAEALIDNADTQQEIDAMLLKLLNSMYALRLKANKENLQNLYDEYSGLWPKDYTPASWAAFTVVMERVKEVLDDPEINEDDQDLIDGLYVELGRAKGALIKISDGSEETEPPTDRTETEDTQSPSDSSGTGETEPPTDGQADDQTDGTKPTSDTAGGKGDSGKDNGKKSPKTGDQISYSVLLLLIASASVLVYFVKRREE